MLDEAVHAGDADGREQRADRGGDEADQQGDQHDDLLLGVGEHGERLQVAVASRKMTVRTASSVLSAISFGVFWRFAPSTSAIMRSRKVSPGRAVMRTTIWSDSTRVPPVTAERSPPASRMTGADSPVMADSSTEAMPSMISPSEGTSSPAETTTTSSTVSCDDGTWSMPPSCRRRLAIVSARVLRSVAAWALPRPSAMASAKLANSTVNHNQSGDEAGEDVLARASSC